MKTARVVIADDHALAREGLRVMLDRSGRFDVVGEAASGEEALALCEQHRPDLALLDIRYGTRGGEAGIDGLEAARLLSDTQPEIAIIILTMHDNADYLRAAIAAGARGFITKDASRDELLAAIDLVAAGGSPIRLRSCAARWWRPVAAPCLPRWNG
ncbi:MAG: response regulator transcription factor [Sphingomonadales bacterium]|nr:response regulator transcription factor [Sphingomonadales bacterium]